MEAPELATLCQDVAWGLREQPPSGVDRLAQTLQALRDAASALSDAARDIEAHLAEAMGDAKEVKVEGVGTLERKASPIKPRWDTERLLPLVAALSRDERLVNTTTGEIETDSDAAVRVLNEVASIAYFRVGELSKRGVDAKAFREQEGWRTTVRIHPAP